MIVELCPIQIGLPKQYRREICSVKIWIFKIKSLSSGHLHLKAIRIYTKNEPERWQRAAEKMVKIAEERKRKKEEAERDRRERKKKKSAADQDSKKGRKELDRRHKNRVCISESKIRAG